MKHFFLAALVAGATLGMADTAEARRGASESQFMDFVSKTTVPGPDGASLSLCHLITKHSVLFLPIYYQSNGYALATNSCDTNQYSPVDASLLASGQVAGFIPADIPAEPQLSFGQVLNGYISMAVGALLAVAAALGVLANRRNRKARLALAGDASPFAMRMLEVMSHAAKADGSIDGNEVGMIAAISQKLTGTTFATDRIVKMIELSETSLTKSGFARFGKGMNAAQKENLMRAALMVVASDGGIDKKEQAFVGGLAKGLGIHKQQANEIFQSVLAPA